MKVGSRQHQNRNDTEVGGQEQHVCCLLILKLGMVWPCPWLKLSHRVEELPAQALSHAMQGLGNSAECTFLAVSGMFPLLHRCCLHQGMLASSRDGMQVVRTIRKLLHREVGHDICSTP